MDPTDDEALDEIDVVLVGGEASARFTDTTDVMTVNAQLPALVQRFHLRVVSGTVGATSFTSKGERAIIGTDPTADLVLADRTVSRFHCEIALDRGRPQVRDLGSRNGTRIDGVAVNYAPLPSGATLTLGRSQVRFDLAPEHIEIPVSDRQQFGSMIGTSVPMRRAFALLERAAASDITVLLVGETGTGKEAAAESIHRESARHGGPFVVVDCGAVPADLLESELFGHEHGAFTGAVATREGAFEAASGGTIFLDEIGELSLSLQPKLLRALERRETKRVGSNRYVPVDVRVVAATHRNLRAEVNAKQFRSDLYYRLAVVEVALPALRERSGDLPLLVEHLLQAMGAAGRPEADSVRTTQFIAEIGRHTWPGNVRELRNYLERCIALREFSPPAQQSLPSSADVLDADKPFKLARESWIRVFERRYLEEVLARANGNVTAAARAANLDRIYFHRLLRRHGLRGL